MGVVFFNLTPGPARPLLPPDPPCEVITKLHECVHRISIKTNTVLPSEREGTFIGKSAKSCANISAIISSVKRTAFDILAAINISRASSRAPAYLFEFRWETET